MPSADPSLWRTRRPRVDLGVLVALASSVAISAAVGLALRLKCLECLRQIVVATHGVFILVGTAGSQPGYLIPPGSVVPSAQARDVAAGFSASAVVGRAP